MKFKLLVLIVFLLLGSELIAQKTNKITIDLMTVVDDKVNITMITPQVNESEIEFQIPKIVPGTYSISDFGRFVNDFTAYAENGDTLVVENLTTNRWLIKNANRLYKISYKVDDTFDSTLDNVVFEPGGTNIEADKDVFVINTFGFVGYLKGYDKIPFELTIKHKEGLYGATSMFGKQIDKTTDAFEAPNYFDLADAPVLYAEPDTTTLNVGGAEILVSLYSPNKTLNSKEVMGEVKEILNAQKEYLGGSLPIKKYAFLIYLFSGQSNSGSYGALEHSYSSLYFLPEAGVERIGQVVRDVAAHEFFHIVTPLSVHAEQIGDFNFIEPEMSEHLWLYEGVTEYAANHVQVKYDLIEEGRFLEIIREKMFGSSRFNRDLAFTEMSANVLDQYEDQYGNVYEKGALIAMCADLILLNESNGSYDLQQLMRDLSSEYGTQKAFKDEELFAKIEALTNKKLGDFLKTHVAGNKRLPFTEILNYAGVDFAEEKEIAVPTLGQISLNVNEDREIFISDVSKLNSFGEKMGYQEGDVIVSFNGNEMTIENGNTLFQEFVTKGKEGDKVKMVVKRTIKGKLKNKKLKAKAETELRKQPYFIEFKTNASEKQLKIRKAWLKP